MTEDTPPLSPKSNNLHAFFAGRMDLPPGVNASYRPGSKTLLDTPEEAEFKRDAALLLSQGYHDYALINAIRASRRKVPLKVNLHFYFKTMWKRDIDGGIKAALDAVFGRLELNDNLIVDLHVTKHVDDQKPRTEIEFYCALPLSH